MREMARLILSFLGSPEVSLAGEMLKFRTRKALAILVFLVLEGGSQPREKLTALLWPESDLPRGQMSLRRALASLRQSLGDTNPIKPAFIHVRGDTLGFSFDADFKLDVAQLEEAIDLIRSPDEAGRTLSQRTLDRLQGAVEAYRGDFLGGFALRNAHPFDEWAGLQRELYHRQMEEVFDCLSKGQYDRGDTAGALETSLRWVAHSDLSEPAYRRLMQVHFAAGHRTAALAAFERCKRVLASELSLAPSRETQALAERIRAERASVSPERTGAGASPPSIATVLERPFVGRAAEHGKLVGLYREALRHRTQVANLVGVAGIGKTRLASEFLRWARSEGAQVLSCRAFETGGNLPYQPWVEILRARVVQEALSTDLIGGVWLGELSRLLPELLDRFPGIAPLKVDEPAAKTRLFESVAKLIESLAESSPLVILVDDFQWADPSSLDLLHYLTCRLGDAEAPVLLVLSVRSEALATTPALRKWLTRLEVEMPSTRLNLAPLPIENTRQWVQSLAGDEADSEVVAGFSAWLQAETAGQPFYIAAMIAALLERGILVLHPGESETLDFRKAVQDIEILRGFIPPGVREVILARLVQLTPDASEMLSAGAVVGHRFTFETLQQVADLPDGRALTALDQLLASHLFMEHTQDALQSEVRPFLFTHDKVRDVAYTEAGAARRRVFHRRALEALSRESAPAAELARHAFEAGLMAPAFRHSIAAGDEAMKLAATQEAIAYFSSARALFAEDKVAQVESHHLVHLFSNLGRALELDSQFHAALEIYKELDELGLKSGDRSMELSALIAQVTLHSTPNAIVNPDQAQSLSERALTLSRDLDDKAAEARLLWCLSHVYRITMRFEDAIGSAERSLALARSQNLREQMALTLNDLGSHGYLMSGRLTAAKQALSEASELWRELDNLPMLVDSLASMALTCAFAGEFGQVYKFSDEAFQISLSTGNLWGQAFSRMQVGFALWEQGHPDQAIAALEESIRTSEAAGFSVPQALTRANLAEVYGGLGAIERGLEVAHLALIAAESSIPHSHRFVLAVMAHLHLLNGDFAEAARCLDQAKAGPDVELFPIFSVRVKLADCELAYLQGACQRAETLSARLLSEITQAGMHAYLPKAYHLQGQIQLALGHTQAAHSSLRKARAAAEASGSRQALWPILLNLSKLASDTEQARGLRQQARAIVEYIGEGISGPELRASFLDQALVREALGS